MSTKGRVDKVAGALGVEGDACVCSPAEFRVRYEDEPEDGSPAKTCAKCDRPREIVRLRVVYEDKRRAA